LWRQSCALCFFISRAALRWLRHRPSARLPDKAAIALERPYEVRQAKDYFDVIEVEKVPKDMLELALHIVESKKGKFEPEKFEDEYESALKELLRKKQKGERIERPKETSRTHIVNLDVCFVPKADIHGPIRSHLDTPNGNQRSISPNTMSREPSIAGTSASMCPRVKKSIAPKCGNDGARILHLYGWLVPSETR
jgi:hypothetical protein